MPPKRKPDKQIVRKAVIVKDPALYSVLECWAIGVNELYNALVAAGFKPSYALGITIDKSPLPEWLFPDFDPFDDGEEEELDDD